MTDYISLSRVEMIVSEYVHEIQFGRIGADVGVVPFKKRVIDELASYGEIDWQAPSRICENFYGGRYSNFMTLEQVISLLGQDHLADIRAHVLSVQTPSISSKKASARL